MRRLEWARAAFAEQRDQLVQDHDDPDLLWRVVCAADHLAEVTEEVLWESS